MERKRFDENPLCEVKENESEKTQPLQPKDLLQSLGSKRK